MAEIICPICEEMYYGRKVGKGLFKESPNNPPMIKNILGEEYNIKKYGMCSKCYNKMHNGGEKENGRKEMSKM